jgi:hypothetical protein
MWSGCSMKLIGQARPAHLRGPTARSAWRECWRARIADRIAGPDAEPPEQVGGPVDACRAAPVVMRGRGVAELAVGQVGEGDASRESAAPRARSGRRSCAPGMACS